MVGAAVGALVVARDEAGLGVDTGGRVVGALVELSINQNQSLYTKNLYQYLHSVSNACMYIIQFG